jgi:release factor glutamine methyltransferase
MLSPASPPDNSPVNPSRDPSENLPETPMDPQWTILKILQWTTAYFKSHHIDSPRLTAEILLAHVLEINRIDLYLRFDQPLNKQELSVFKGLIKRRLHREPVAYITGTREFWGIDFTVTPDVLIPRPETEFLVEEALKLIPLDTSSGRYRLIDVGTGSGAVAVALAASRPGHFYIASDISKKAIAVASQNADQNSVSKDIFFFVGELFEALRLDVLKFDLIVSNPPYIPIAQIAGLEPEVGKHEPLSALDGGPEGLDVIARIVEEAPLYLKKNGMLMLEIGYDQKDRMEQIVADDGRYSELNFIRDYSGHNRVAQMRLK